VQDTRIAEAFEIVNAGAVGGACDTRSPAESAAAPVSLRKSRRRIVIAMSPREMEPTTVIASASEAIHSTDTTVVDCFVAPLLAMTTNTI